MFEEVISVAASLLTTMETTDGLMDLCFMSTRPELITAGRGFAQTSQQLEALATLRMNEQDPADFLQMLGEHARRMSGCLYVCGGFGEAQAAVLAAVENRGVQTAVFVVSDKHDDTPYRSDFHVLTPGEVESGLANL